jgi:ACS family hexuronate transporter-like MFS transporter
VIPTAPSRPWLVLATLGLAFALSSGDRAVLPVLKSTLATTLGLNNDDYARLVTAFMVTYASMYLLAGNIINRLGVRTTLTACLGGMSVAVALAGTARGFPQLLLAQIVLGLAQAAVAPAVTYAIVTRIAPHRHAFGYSVVNAIQSSATILCPPVVAVVTFLAGWRWAFLLPAFAGAGIAALWWQADTLGRTHPMEPAAAEGVLSSFRALLRLKPVRILFLARMVSDPFWFFFQFWQMAFLRERVGMSLATLGRLAWIPPLVSVLAVFGFALLSDRMVARGWPAAKARVVPMLLATALAPAAFCLPFATAKTTAILLCALVSLICAVWLSLSAILMGALVPRPLFAPALGLMSALGCVPAIAFNLLAAPLIDRFGYNGPFWIGACLHPLAAGLLAWHFLRAPTGPANPAPPA